ncbi:MAG: hypothetical protein ACRDRH_10935 [Pseudonocardia sp.]
MTEIDVGARAVLPTHDLLLAMAGRVDDDLLTWTRELAAVGEEFRAVELLTATLIADRVALPSRVRAAIVEAGRTVRTEFDAELTLPPAREDERDGEPGTAHRFDPAQSGAGTDRITTTLHGLPSRQVAGCRVWLTWRITPTGSAPGPLPHAVVLVEIVDDDGASRAASADVLAYQFASALEHAGTPASVEVFTAGAQLPDYHQAALRTAHLLAATATERDGNSAPPSLTAVTSRHAEVDLPEPVVAPEQLLADRSDPAEQPSVPSAPLTAPPSSAATRFLAPLNEPPRAPRLGPVIDENDPLGLGDLPAPMAEEGTGAQDRRPTLDSWTAPTNGLFDPAPPTRRRHSADQPSAGLAGHRDPGPRNGESFPLRGSATWNRPVPESSPDRPPGDPTTEPAIDAAGLGLRPESLARLNDTDRALLAQLQAELGPRAGGPGLGGHPDGTPTNRTNGAAPRRRARPPDIAD